MATKARRKVVRTLSKGQITIPREFRTALGIEPDTLISVSLIRDHLEVTPIQAREEDLRLYTDEDIAQFLEDDKLDEETAKRVRKWLDQGKV